MTKSKILFYCLPGIGDAIMMTPAIKALRDQYPNAEISILTMYRSVHQMVEGLDTVDVIYLWDFFEKPLMRSLGFAWKLRKVNYDITIMGFPANRKEYSILSLLIGGKKRVGHWYSSMNVSSFNFLYTDKVVKDPLLHNVVENLKLVELLNPGLDKTEYQKLDFPLSQNTFLFSDHWVKNNFPHRKVIGLHPGSSTLKNHINKRWPKEYFRELTERLVDVGYGVVVAGGPEEDELKRFVAADKGVVVSGTTLPQVASIIRKCVAFVSNDSGMMHLAASQETPVVGLFGPTSSVYAHPYSQNSVAMTSGFECSPCFDYTKKPLNCSMYGDYRCLKNISVDKVFAEVINLVD